MRRIETLVFSLLVVGCGARTDAFGDDPIESIGGHSGTDPQGIGGHAGATTALVGGQSGWTVPSGGTGWGGIPNTYTWWTGQGGWGAGGVTWATIAVGGWGNGGFTSTIWTTWVPQGGTYPKGGASGTGGYKTSTGGTKPITGGASGTGGYKTSTGGTKPITGGTSGTGGYKTSTGGTSGAGGYKTTTGGTSGTGGTKTSYGGISGTGGYKTTTGGTTSTGGSGALTTLVTETCLQLATTSCQKCLCGVCAQPAVNCLSDTGCVSIVSCVIETKCIMSGVGCYAPTMCKSVIDANGGFLSPSMSYASSMANCVLTSACGC